MKILTCATPDAIKKAKLYNIHIRLQNLLSKIEEEQSFDLLIRWHNFFLIKKWGRDYRVLYSEHKIDEYTILCMVDVFNRGEKAYDEMLRKITKIDQADAIFQQIHAQHETLLLDRIRAHKHNPAPPSLPGLDDILYVWLNQKKPQDSGITVFETEDWIRLYKNEYFQRSANAIYGLLGKCLPEIEEMIKNGSNTTQHKPNTNGLMPYFEGNDGIQDFRIYYQCFAEHDAFVLSGLKRKNEDIDDIYFIPPHVSREELLKQARRAYPLDTFMLEADEFYRIQDAKEGNLALSPEENDILHQIHSHDQQRFPLFINGRAGSGKSTLLQYLLKDYLYLACQHWQEDQPFAPLYLTYSRKLLETANRHVRMLLDANAADLLQRDNPGKINYQKHKERVFKQTFQLFGDFLKGLLSDDERMKFDSQIHINYARFKKIWSQTKNKHLREKDIDLAWHIIRTYIKGMAYSSDEFMTPEQYSALPMKQKTVTDEDFSRIYHHVWEGWYKDYCKKNSWWDDQDLARMVLSEGDFPQSYPAIFCDEAQDFTSIELKILHNLSLFSERCVPSHEISNIPFIFAGDPLQTLNPTGFRWESVKASFHKYLLAPLDNRAQAKTEFNYRELFANYRSSKEIVNFCNYIQLLRMCLFPEHHYIRPQHVWFSGAKTMRPFFYPTEGIKTQELLKTSGMIIIPDCHEGEEISYVQNDKLLSQCIERDEKSIPKGVFSPNATKGLEYEQVVILYRFGATCPNTLKDYLKQGQHTKIPEASITINWEYFLNRLYVAASRACRRLIIIDDRDAYNQFWKFLETTDAENIIRHFGVNVDPEIWSGDRILFITKGTDKDIDDVLKDRMAPKDILEQANKWRQEGIDNENADFLRQARMCYEELQENAKARDCYARALRIEGHYEKAAEQFLQIDQIRALECLWSCQNFSRIKNIQWEKEMSHDLRIDLAAAFNNVGDKIVYADKTEKIGNILERINKFLRNSDHSFDENKTWHDVIKTLLNAVHDLTTPNTKIAKYADVKELAKRIHYSDEKQAKIFYILENYSAAKKLFEELERTNQKIYLYCLCETQSWPDVLKPLKQLEDWQEIIHRWHTQDKSTKHLEQEHASILITAMIEQSMFKDAAYLLINEKIITAANYLKPLTQRLFRYVDKLPTHIQADMIRLHINAIIDTQAFELLENVMTKVDDNKNLHRTTRNGLDKHILERIANANILQYADINHKDQVAKFIKTRYWSTKKGFMRWQKIILKEISLPLLGAVIELSNKLDDAIDYYTWMASIKREMTEKEKYYVDARLGACLQKRSVWKNKYAETTHAHKTKYIAASQVDQSKADDLKKLLGIEIFDEYPSLLEYPGNPVKPRWVVDYMIEKEKYSSEEENNAAVNMRSKLHAGDTKAWLEWVEAYILQLVQAKKWYLIVYDWLNLETLRISYPNVTEETIEELFTRILILLLAPVTQHHSMAIDIKDTLYELYMPRLYNEAESWHASERYTKDYMLIGAVVERLGKYIESIDFYNWLLKQHERVDNAEQIAIPRLIVLHEQYANYLLKKGKTYGDQNNKHERLHEKAYKLRCEHDLVGVDIPQYPALSKPQPDDTHTN